MDQYVYPYYEKSRSEGMSEEQALELLENLWLRTFTVNKIRSWSHTRFSAGSPLYQNVTVAGQTVDGKDAVNKLSYLILRSVARRTAATEPHGSLPQGTQRRIHAGVHSGDPLRLRHAASAATRSSSPSFLNLGVKKRMRITTAAPSAALVAVPGKWGLPAGISFLTFQRR